MTATADPTTLEIGKARTRKEDARLITGRSRYTDSITPHGTLHMHVVRSPLAHATITGVDKTAAEASPGVVGVYTAADLGVEAVGLPCAWPITPDMKSPQRPLLANTTVHFAGEGVAVVLARTAAEARDAGDLVEIDYDPLEPVLDMEEALAQGATLVHPDLGTNENATWVFDSGAAGTGSSIDEAIAAAEADPDSIVVKRRFIQQRLIPAFMEPRSCVVDPSGEQITVYAATQVPHILRTMTTVTLGVPESKLRVIAPDVGGGFGGKIGVLPEEMLCVAIAQKLGKPVKWTETRSESLLA
ncbi:MAG: aerobic carbon-monoxide dehydrogenase large subunit, partial [Pseudonocardiales bacterium]|nr:aerobic carbon-monoxide dehydrogenase large subunit [Pseudonocardiales bacterium]